MAAFLQILIVSIVFPGSQLASFFPAFFINSTFYLFYLQCFVPLYLIYTRLQVLNKILKLKQCFNLNLISEIVDVVQLIYQTFAVQIIILRLEIWLWGSFTMFAIFEAFLTGSQMWKMTAITMTILNSLDFVGFAIINVVLSFVSSEVS